MTVVYLLYSGHEHHGGNRLVGVYSSVELAKQQTQIIENYGAKRYGKEDPVIRWHETDETLWRGYSPSYYEYRIEAYAVDAERFKEPD